MAYVRLSGSKKSAFTGQMPHTKLEKKDNNITCSK